MIRNFGRRIFLILSPILFLSLIGCSGNLVGLAESILYPFEKVNRDYPVPEIPPPGFEQVYLPIQSTDGTTIQIHAWYKKISGSKRTLVYLHGNGENLQSLYQYGFLDAITERIQTNYIVIDYPGLGRSTGTPNQFNLTNAALAAVSAATKLFPKTEIFVWGRSLGASPATLAAEKAQHLISGLALTSPWSSFMELALSKTGLAKDLPKDWLALHAYDSAKAAAKIKIPVIIHHGAKDELIPLKLGEKLFKSFPLRAITFMTVIEGLGHNDIFTAPELWEQIREFSNQ